MVSALPLNRRVTIYILRKPNNFQTVTFCSNAPASPSLDNEEHVGGTQFAYQGSRSIAPSPCFHTVQPSQTVCACAKWHHFIV